jgi:E3 ubiquitin-protein ligase DOA10
MKRIIIIIITIVLWFCIFPGCSTIYMKESFTDFSNSTKTIGKNTAYCFDRQFLLQVSLPWPEKETSREKYAKIGVKILERKREINSMLQEVIKALDFIPLTHNEMIRLLKYNDSPITTLDQLTNFGARLEEMYVEIAKKKK